VGAQKAEEVQIVKVNNKLKRQDLGVVHTWKKNWLS